MRSSDLTWRVTSAAQTTNCFFHYFLHYLRCCFVASSCPLKMGLLSSTAFETKVSSGKGLHASTGSMPQRRYCSEQMLKSFREIMHWNFRKRKFPGILLCWAPRQNSWRLSACLSTSPACLVAVADSAGLALFDRAGRLLWSSSNLYTTH
jgi:hypothetical protein